MLREGYKVNRSMQRAFACVVDIFDSGIRMRKFSAIDPKLAKIRN
jgi:hypothetical protein